MSSQNRNRKKFQLINKVDCLIDRRDYLIDKNSTPINNGIEEYALNECSWRTRKNQYKIGLLKKETPRVK
jgi:hypothetical protein